MNGATEEMWGYGNKREEKNQQEINRRGGGGWSIKRVEIEGKGWWRG